MNSIQDTINSNTPSLLYGAMLVANIDYVGIVDYTVKAFVGGLFWLGFKLTGDWLARRAKNKNNGKK